MFPGRSQLLAIAFLGGARSAAAQITPTPGCKLAATGAVSVTMPCQVSFLSPPNTNQGSAIVNATTTAGNQRTTITVAITFSGPVSAGNVVQSNSRVKAFQFQVMQAGPQVMMWMGHQATTDEPMAGTFQLNITSLTPGAAGSSIATGHGTLTATVPPMKGGSAKGNIVLDVTF